MPKGEHGRGGAPPKRSDQRRRRNKVDIDKPEVSGTVAVPELGLEDPHPIAVDFYKALQQSGQARYYEPSDWQRARVAMKFLSQLLKANKPSSLMYTAVQHDLTALLTTEGDRRRLRMEVQRAEQTPTEDDPRVALLDSYRQAQ